MLRRHFPGVLATLWQEEVATVGQLQLLFAQHMPTPRTAQRHVAELGAAGYVAEVPIRNRQRTEERPLQVTAQGIKLVEAVFADRFGKRLPHQPPPRRTAQPRTIRFIDHELLVTDTYVYAVNSASGRPDVELRTTVRNPQLSYRWQGKRYHFEPDRLLVWLHQRYARRWLELTFVEADRGNEYLGELDGKLCNYEHWHTQAGDQYLRSWQHRLLPEDDNLPDLRLLVVAGSRQGPSRDQRRVTQIYTLCLERSAALRRRIWLASARNLIGHRSADAPIWHKPHDASAWLAPYWQYVKTLPQTPEGDEARWQFVGDRLQQTKSYLLLPPVAEPEPVPQPIGVEQPLTV